MNLYLKLEEAKFLSLAVVTLITEIEAGSKNATINWNPESRKRFKEMLAAGAGLRIKLRNLGFDMDDLPDVKDGEESDYLTKES